MSELPLRIQALKTRRTDDLSGDYVLDPTHSRIGFVTRHAMVTRVRGQFTRFEGRAHLDFARPAASGVEVVIEVASIDTRDPHRDEHLRTNDFFDAPAHPHLAFRSTHVHPLGGADHRVTGDLTIKAVTLPVSVDFEYTGAARDPFGTTRLGFEGSTRINRRDWGVEWNAPLETGGVLVSETVVLEFEISAVPATAG
ncbi:YceI family protein [Kineococcus sp. SYSU DK018]|uniref:YceI family protein n=1 Tax=Kineococcus sp. SYSU DK018 TaxID=3383139 RepID=UPI003D7E2EAD